MSRPMRYANAARNVSPTGVVGSTNRMKQRHGSQSGDVMTPSSVSTTAVDDDDFMVLKRRFQDIEERRLREWENYQRSHRSSLEQLGARAYMDLTIGDVPIGRIVVELFEEAVPNTVENFRKLVTGSVPYDPYPSPPPAAAAATGSNGDQTPPTTAAQSTTPPLTQQPSLLPKRDYIDSTVYHINKRDRYFCLGELGHRSVSSSPSGAPLPDESFAVRHGSRGMLSMVSRGPNTSGSAFCITLDAAPKLDFKQVVFGRIVDGLQILDKIEAVATSRTGTPLQPIAVAFCGALTGPKPAGVFEIARRVVPAAPVPPSTEGSSSNLTAAAAAGGHSNASTAPGSHSGSMQLDNFPSTEPQLAAENEAPTDP